MRDQLFRFAAPVALLGVLGACAGSSPASGHGGAGSGAEPSVSASSSSSGESPSSSSSGSGGGSSSSSSGNGGATSSTSTNASSTSASSSTSGSSAASTTSSSSGAATGWTAVALLDDSSDPKNTIFRSGNDLVTGIYFKSLTEGWVTTAGSNGSFGNGGAIYAATQKQLTSLLFSGNRDGLCLVGAIDFHGLESSPDGLVALGYACDVIASHDGGKTFGIQRALAGDSFGIEPVLALRSRKSGSLVVAETGYAASAPTAPGPNAVWTFTWAPEGSPPVPDPVPSTACQMGPHSGVPTQRTSVYVSPDGGFAAYVSATDEGAQICVSTDGGNSFNPSMLSGLKADAQTAVPRGVTFASASVGVTFWGDSVYPGEAYVYRTTDAGKTWSAASVPAGVVSRSIELASAFFAPDGTHGFIVGYDYDGMTPILLRSEDAGATWTSATGDLAAKVGAAGGGKLHSGFALDAAHIWVGGDHGVLMASDTSGQ